MRFCLIILGVLLIQLHTYGQSVLSEMQLVAIKQVVGHDTWWYDDINRNGKQEFTLNNPGIYRLTRTEEANIDAPKVMIEGACEVTEQSNGDFAEIVSKGQCKISWESSEEGVITLFTKYDAYRKFGIRNRTLKDNVGQLITQVIPASGWHVIVYTDRLLPKTLAALSAISENTSLNAQVSIATVVGREHIGDAGDLRVAEISGIHRPYYEDMLFNELTVIVNAEGQSVFWHIGDQISIGELLVRRLTELNY